MSSSKPRPTCCCPDKCFLIKSITSVATLDLQGNNIGPKGAQALAGEMQWNTSVVTMDLQDNNTGSEGTEALAGLLQGNTSVTILHRNMRREQDQATAPIFSRVVRWVGRIHSVNSSRIYESRLWLLVAQYAFTTPKGRKDALRAARSHTQ